MKKIIKDFKKFPSGSSGHNISREVITEKDTKQLMKERDEEFK